MAKRQFIPNNQGRKRGRPTKQEQARSTRKAARDEKGRLACPGCLSQSHSYVVDYDYDEKTRQYVFRYRCKYCNISFHSEQSFEEVWYRNKKASGEELS